MVDFEYFLDEQTFQLLPAVIEPLSVGRIYYPDESIGLFEVVLPICAECLLAADVPLGLSVMEGKRRVVTSQMFSLYLFTSSACALPTHMLWQLTPRSRLSL